jgi:alpha-D-ribose 1-methylphosphonate 5-triphosphate synthase subunit PhnH
MMEPLTLDGGFAEPVFGAQTAFRALMDALANPGQAQPLGRELTTHYGLAPGLAAVALTMCDHDTTLWLDPVLAGSEPLVAWLRFHTAAPLLADPMEAQFALVSSGADLPMLGRFALGTDEYPDRSTTIAVALPSLSGGPALMVRGPGIKDFRAIAPAGLPADFVAQWGANRAAFPRGVDLLLVADGQVIGLPRSTRISVES